MSGALDRKRPFAKIGAVRGHGVELPHVLAHRIEQRSETLLSDLRSEALLYARKKRVERGNDAIRTDEPDATRQPIQLRPRRGIPTFEQAINLACARHIKVAADLVVRPSLLDTSLFSISSDLPTGDPGCDGRVDRNGQEADHKCNRPGHERRHDLRLRYRPSHNSPTSDKGHYQI